MPEVTIVVSLITALAAIIAPVITAIINNRANRKIKVLELFYQRKTDAYLEFMKAASAVLVNGRPAQELLAQIQEAGSVALLFSSKETQSKISKYCAMLLKSDYSPSGLAALSQSYHDAIISMQEEINEYRE